MHKSYSVVLTSTDIDESYSIFYILWIYYKSLSETPKFEMLNVLFFYVDDFFVSGFEVSALDNAIFQRSIVQKLGFMYVIWLKLTAVRCFEYWIIKSFNENNLI